MSPSRLYRPVAFLVGVGLLVGEALFRHPADAAVMTAGLALVLSPLASQIDPWRDRVLDRRGSRRGLGSPRPGSPRPPAKLRKRR